MITSEDQNSLFRLIAGHLQRDLQCYAFGGNAMIFYGYKDDTKDVDLLFEEQESREEFIRVIGSLGFEKWNPGGIYVPEKLRVAHAPLVFKGESGRFDLFVGKIFQTMLSPKMKEDLYAVHDFQGKHLLRVHVLRKEHLVLLKAVTERQNDFDDIRTIVEKDTRFDWQYLIDEVLWQYQHGDGWVLLDVEKMLQELKKYLFIEEKYFQQLYRASGKDKKS